VVILKRALKPLVVTRLRRDPLGLFTDLKREQGDHARVRFGRDTLSLISHPDDIQHMLVSGDRDFPRLNVTVKRWRRRARRRTSGVTLGPGADPTLRLAFRRALQPTYSRARIDSLWPELVRAAEEGVERWPDAGTIGVVREVEPLGMDLVVRAVFGQQLDLPLSELVARIHACVDLRVYASSAAYRVTDRLRLRRILRAAEAYELLEALLRRHLAQRRSEPARGDDVLSRLLGVDEAKGLGDEQLVLEALAQLFVGGEQVANVASWALQLLSQHPAERDRLRRESGGRARRPQAALPHVRGRRGGPAPAPTGHADRASGRRRHGARRPARPRWRPGAGLPVSRPAGRALVAESRRIRAGALARRQCGAAT